MISALWQRVRKILSQLEEKCEKETDFVKLATFGAEKTGDKKWARSIYAKAEQTIDAGLRYELAISLAEKLNDRKWAFRVRRHLEA